MDETDDHKVESIARELANWHGSAYAFQDRDGQMQTIASSFAGHRWAHASDEYVRAKWKQYRGAARYVIGMVDSERDALIAEITRLREELAKERVWEVDPTAQSEPLTEGQRIVAWWETSTIAEPCELAQKIDQALTRLREERDAAIRETGALRDGVTKAIGLQWHSMPSGGSVCPDDKDITAACARLWEERDGAVRAEREACAKVADAWKEKDERALTPWIVADEVAAAIRSR